jgi:hypothetical protein
MKFLVFIIMIIKFQNQLEIYLVVKFLKMVQTTLLNFSDNLLLFYDNVFNKKR